MLFRIRPTSGVAMGCATYAVHRGVARGVHVSPGAELGEGRGQNWVCLGRFFTCQGFSKNLEIVVTTTTFFSVSRFF